MKKELVPSLLSANFYNLECDLNILKYNGIKLIHLDVMDGNFVPNLSIGVPVIESINKYAGNDFILDTHLMIEKPERYIETFKKAGSDILTVHLEAVQDLPKTIELIKNNDMKAGVCINPETDVQSLNYILNDVDLVLVMSVHPGFGGQKFMPVSIDKVRYLYDMREKSNYKYIIEIDGGIDKVNLKTVLDAGVDYVVAGSSVFKGDIKKNINELTNIIGADNE